MDHAQLIKELDAFLDKYQADLSYCHGADHSRRVARLAVKLASDVGADRELVEVAALLHDIGYVPLGWSKIALGRDESVYLDFLGTYILPTSDHADLGAQVAGRFLERVGMDDERIQHVRQIISEHNKEHQSTLESQVLSDADRLELLGATWVARAFQRASAFDKRLGVESVPGRYLTAGKELVSALHTESAKRIGTERYAFLVAFRERFERELRMEA